MVVHASGILRVRILVDGAASLLFRKELFDFPVVRLNSNGELQILLCDIVPELEKWAQLDKMQSGVGFGGLASRDIPYRPS